jgi:hypothetical protein
VGETVTSSFLSAEPIHSWIGNRLKIVLFQASLPLENNSLTLPATGDVHDGQVSLLDWFYRRHDEVRVLADDPSNLLD